MRDVITTAERVLGDVDSPYMPTIQAIREYAKNELR